MTTLDAEATYAPGWYQDPENESQLRYYDGTIWTEHCHALQSYGGGDRELVTTNASYAGHPDKSQSAANTSRMRICTAFNVAALIAFIPGYVWPALVQRIFTKEIFYYMSIARKSMIFLSVTAVVLVVPSSIYAIRQSVKNPRSMKYLLANISLLLFGIFAALFGIGTIILVMIFHGNDIN